MLLYISEGWGKFPLWFGSEGCWDCWYKYLNYSRHPGWHAVVVVEGFGMHDTTQNLKLD
jgi:hypothetical protein